MIILPFGYFVNKSYQSVRSDVILDSKTGKIKQAFIRGWLKEVALDQAILQNKDLRWQSLRLLEDIVQVPDFQTSALQMWVNVMHRQPAVEEAKDVCFVIAKHILTADKRESEGFSAVFSSIPYTLDWPEHITQYLVSAPLVSTLNKLI